MFVLYSTGRGKRKAKMKGGWGRKWVGWWSCVSHERVKGNETEAKKGKEKEERRSERMKQEEERRRIRKKVKWGRKHDWGSVLLLLGRKTLKGSNEQEKCVERKHEFEKYTSKCMRGKLYKENRREVNLSYKAWRDERRLKERDEYDGRRRLNQGRKKGGMQKERCRDDYYEEGQW